MSPWYRRHGKLMTPLTDQQWITYMHKGDFVQRKHRGLMALLYYSAVRRTEALKSLKTQFKETDRYIIFDVGKRLKHSAKTPPLNIPLSLPFVDEIAWCVSNTEPQVRVWPYSGRTVWNIFNRVLPGYPHYFRLSRITNFFLDGWTIPQVRSWTGLSLRALNYYVGMVDVKQMGDSLK